MPNPIPALHAIRDARDTTTRLHLMRIPLNRDGYDITGRYFGVGMPLYAYCTEYDACHYANGYVRAWDRGHARDILERMFGTRIKFVHE